MKNKILLIILLTIISLSVYLLPKNNNTMSLVNDNMLSFTVDGVESKTMPTKGSGYIASKITCTKGSIITFDNDNYTIEVEKLDNEDVCKIDFSKEMGSNTVTITTGDTSKIDSTSKTTTEGGKVVFYLTEEPDSVTGGDYTLTDNKLTVSNVTTNVNLNITMTKTLYYRLLADKTTRPGERTDFSSVLTADNTKTLYTGTEDGMSVYYFAGNATDNWVKFAGFYWRIIRTNSDGSIRLLYHGTSSDTTEAYISSNTQFFYLRNNPMYVGYMYGTSGSLTNNRINTNDSTIKKVIDEWYINNLNTNYGKYISTAAIYCNDRNNTTGDYNTGSTMFYYDGYTRLNENKTPTYDCTATEDKFTVDSSTGNGKLTYPISLMTADEIAFAGGVSDKTAPTWYYYNSAKGSSTGSTWWWLLSPGLWYERNAFVFNVGGSGYSGKLNCSDADAGYSVRPVLSLKSCVKYASGDGTSSNPYTIEETSSGC